MQIALCGLCAEVIGLKRMHCISVLIFHRLTQGLQSVHCQYAQKTWLSQSKANEVHIFLFKMHGFC